MYTNNKTNVKQKFQVSTFVNYNKIIKSLDEKSKNLTLLTNVVTLIKN